MVEFILEMLKQGDYYGVSENIDIAKGKYKSPTNLKEVTKTVKRWQKAN